MKKRRYTDQQVLDEANYIIDTWATYKRTADHFCMPRSTVGWHMKTRLQDLDLGLYNKVQNITYVSYTERFARWSESLEG